MQNTTYFQISLVLQTCKVFHETKIMFSYAKKNFLTKPIFIIDLRSFVMENHRFDTSSDLEDIVTTRDLLPTRLTERSFVHGFMKLPRLLTLSVTVASYTVPEHLVRVLKETIGNVNIVQMQNLYRHNQM